VQAQGMTLEISEQAKEVLAREGFDPSFGARPLRRAIQRMIEDPLAEEMLKGIYEVGDVIRAEVKDGDIVFVKGAPVQVGEEETPPQPEPAGVA